MTRPDPPSDRDIQEAFRALDGTLRDGQLDDFSSRVLARLDEPEASGMDSRELARGSGVGRPDEAAMGAVPEPAPDENSGLHEIKALASTTRRRISQKITSEKEGEESLLVGATSGSFRAAALPDPAREKVAGPARPVVRAASEVDRRPTPSRSSSAPFWVLGGVATAAAAAAVAVFVFGVGREKIDKQAPASDVVARSENTTATPAADMGAAPGGGGDLKFAEPPPPPAAEPTAPAPQGAQVTAGAASVSPDETVARGDAEGGLAKGRAGSKAEPAKESREQKESEKDKKSAPPASKTDGKSGGKDLDDVLDQVAGKVEKPAQVEEEGPKKPSKKELDRADVSKAMGAVRASVMRCRDKEQFEGTVTVKFQVAPSGQVTSAEATGSKAGSPTGACVAAAVKKAKFPAFDGAPTSFTYPFLLAE